MKDVFGMTPQAFRRQCLLETLLDLYESHPSFSIKETAHAVGYTPAAFVRLNRRLFGMTPRDVRAEVITLRAIFETGKSSTIRGSKIS